LSLQLDKRKLKLLHLRLI